MSDEQELHHLHTPNARKSGPLSPDQREKKQAKFLKVFRETANIKYSCAIAGVSRHTFYDWREHDAAFAEQLPDAESDANDTLEQAAYDRAVNGVPSYVVSQGKIVYEDIPDTDENGNPKLDKQNNPLMKRGNPLIERKYSDALLTTLLKARMPHKYKDQTKVEHTGPGGGPLQQRIEIYKVRLPDNGRDTPIEKGDTT